MANPRQKRKQKSLSHRPVRHANHAKRNLKKMPPLRAPKLLQDAWDRHLTVKQNYTALGLLSSLNPRAKGGAETVPPDVTLLPKSVPPAANTSITVASASLPKGHGRIIRDEHGNVVDVQLNGEDWDEDMKRDKEDETPWGATMEDWGNEGTVMPEIEGKTEVIKALESYAISATKAPRRHASYGEVEWLRELVKVYGNDFAKASCDRRRNPWQRTEGEIRRSVFKAGGVQKLLNL